MDIKKASKNNAPTKFVQMSMFDEEEGFQPTIPLSIGDRKSEDTMAYFDEINKDEVTII